jgi:hypothetical protein
VAQSVVAGDAVALHVSCSAPRFDVEGVRQGAEGVRVLERAGLAGRDHPLPADAASHGCGWPVALELRTEPGWRPGFHLVRLRAGDVSVGHDEYWSAGMRDAVEAHVARGGGAAFFSGNVAYWRIRYEDGHTA